LRANREDLVALLGDEKAEQLNRKEMRRYRKRSPGKAGKRTGTPAHLAAWKAEGQIKSALQRLSTAKLADSLEGRIAASFALLHVGGFKNVWDVSQADVGALLKVRGIGPASLEAVEQYLTGRQVKLSWTVHD
jgi:hypothetical protein